MATLSLTLPRDNILADMKVKSHVEVANIADPSERFFAELGEEKTEEAQQCINDAANELASVLRPFLSSEETITDEAEVEYEGSDDIEFSLTVTSRKADGLAVALANAAHTYIVDCALAKYYISVSHPEIAERHLSKLQGDAGVIQNLIRRRKSPSYTAYSSNSSSSSSSSSSSDTNTTP